MEPAEGKRFAKTSADTSPAAKDVPPAYKHVQRDGQPSRRPGSVPAAGTASDTSQDVVQNIPGGPDGPDERARRATSPPPATPTSANGMADAASPRVPAASIAADTSPDVIQDVPGGPDVPDERAWCAMTPPPGTSTRANGVYQRPHHFL